MRVRGSAKPAPKLTTATAKALADARLSSCDSDDDDIDWGALPSNVERAGFDKRRIGS